MARQPAAPATPSTCPPLPAGSLSLNDLHDAAVKGKDLTTIVSPPAETVEAAEPAPPAAE